MGVTNQNNQSDKSTAQDPLPAPVRSGFKTKPFRIHVISLSLIALPAISYLKALYGVGIPNWYSPEVWVAHAGKISSSQWVLIGLTIASGALISMVRRGTLLVAVLSMIGIFSYHLFVSNKIMLLSLAIPTLLLASSFRLPYFHSELRWWEQFPRFLIRQQQVRVLLGLQAHNLHLNNLSLSGAFLDTQQKLRVPAIGERLVVEVTSDLQLGATVVRHQGNCFGVKFDPLKRDQKKQLQHYIETHKKPLSLAR